MVLMRVAAVAALVVVATSCGAANATRGERDGSALQGPGANFTFNAEDGAHPVAGRSGEWVAPSSEIMVWENENIVKIDAAADQSGSDFIRVELSGPGGVPLEAGSYPDARNRDEAPASPGMLVISNGLGCGDEYGEFVIDRIERNATGLLVAFEANFSQRCGGVDRPALHGKVHFQSGPG